MFYPSVFADVVKQLASRHILHDHEEICWCTYYLVAGTRTRCVKMSSLQFESHLCLSTLFISREFVSNLTENTR